jgi:hypothetical protein
LRQAQAKLKVLEAAMVCRFQQHRVASCVSLCDLLGTCCCCQARATLKDLEAAMVRHFQQHAERQQTVPHFVAAQSLCCVGAFAVMPQAQAKLKDLEAAMVRHFQQHAERAGLGLELLPGVKALLEALQVRC